MRLQKVVAPLATRVLLLGVLEYFPFGSQKNPLEAIYERIPPRTRLYLFGCKRKKKDRIHRRALQIFNLGTPQLSLRWWKNGALCNAKSVSVAGRKRAHDTWDNTWDILYNRCTRCNNARGREERRGTFGRSSGA